MLVNFSGPGKPGADQSPFCSSHPSYYVTTKDACNVVCTKVQLARNRVANALTVRSGQLLCSCLCLHVVRSAETLVRVVMLLASLETSLRQLIIRRFNKLSAHILKTFAMIVQGLIQVFARSSRAVESTVATTLF